MPLNPNFLKVSLSLHEVLMTKALVTKRTLNASITAGKRTRMWYYLKIQEGDVAKGGMGQISINGSELMSDTFSINETGQISDESFINEAGYISDTLSINETQQMSGDCLDYGSVEGLDDVTEDDVSWVEIMSQVDEILSEVELSQVDQVISGVSDITGLTVSELTDLSWTESSWSDSARQVYSEDVRELSADEHWESDRDIYTV